jgi:hypothetical protein
LSFEILDNSQLDCNYDRRSFVTMTSI